MIRAWLGAHRRAVWSATAGLVVAALIVTVAVVSSGYAEQRMRLGDGAVWVTNGTTQLVGRANTQINALNTVVSGTSRSLDVRQSGKTVLVVDHGNNTVSAVDPATATAGKAVALPPRDPQVALAGSRAVITAEGSGQVWITPANHIDDFDALASPTLDLGGKAASSLDDAGLYFAYVRSSGTLYRVDAADSDAATTTTVKLGQSSGDVQVTSVDGHWAILSPRDGVLVTEHGTIELPAWLGRDAMLAQASASGDTFYVASSAGLVAVPVAGDEARTVLRKALGKPAAPASADGCVYAAWAGGTSWSTCGSPARGSTGSLEHVAAGAELVFRANQGYLVLNDTEHGTSWDVQNGNALIDNWDDFAHKDDTEQQVEENDEDTPPTYDKNQQPPVAVDDDFGARPGRVSSLPVLLNDYDPNGDVLVIDAVSAVPADQGAVQRVAGNQRLQITLPPDASGTISFDYTISDGRGGTASASVTVTVRADGENSAPVQAHATKATVVAGGRVTTQVLGDWYDPDGDPFYVSGASVGESGQVTFTPQGSVVYTDKSTAAGLVTASIQVSDGSAQGSGTLGITVRSPGEAAIIPEPFGVLATAGEETTIEPLPHVRGGNGALRLSAVPAKADATLTPDFDGGTFRFTSTSIGTHYIDYAVTDGTGTATGVVRVDVQAPPDAGAAPVVVPHTAFIQEQSAQQVDVLATDFDPAGGVLLITGTLNVPAASGVRVEVLDQRILRVTLTRPLDQPVTFNYRVSNGLAETQGAVTVVQIPRPSVRQPPVANPDSVTVRVGDVVDIPVLANDEQPDGDELSLDPELATPVPAGGGLLFASGKVLRYLAPDKPGNFTAAYRVDAPDGQWATAQVTIAVRELDESSNKAPVPQTVTARVLAGDAVRIPIPLDGIDPDGDSVKLVGQESNPDKGAVTTVGNDWIEYQAGEYSTGTDTFQYDVVDTLGAHATGTVRVGIAPPLEGARNPVAVEDEVQVRPGRTVSVRVLENDSDPDNGALTITSVKRTGTKGATAKVVGDLVRVKAPSTEGRFGFIYTIQNETGGTSSNFLTVVVNKDASLARPQVTDTVLGLSDVLGHKSVSVDVLANVFFADGPVRSLLLKVQPGYTDTAHVTAAKRIRVTVEDTSQIIPFQVAHPDDPDIVSYGFVWVPGRDDALPQLKKGMRALKVPSEKQLTIELNDYVIAASGKKVRLTDTSTVQATHANGDKLAKDGDTLVFTSAARYFGPASISFEVTDGDSADDPNGHVATLVLPITVTPRENQPPVFTGGQIDFEPGQQKTVDLVKLTRYPYSNDLDELGYRVVDPAPTGVGLAIKGQKLSITAPENAKKGTTIEVLIGVRDAVNDGRTGRIRLSIVPSTRPLAIPQPDEQIAPRGKTTTVDVLANDGATNPFPGTPLKVVAVTGIDNGSLPAGVSVTPSADKSVLSVTVSGSAAAVDTNLQYEVADATGDPDRYTWGRVRISVQDRPDPVSNVQVTSVGDRAITLAWQPGAFNNSPITGYEVTVSRSGYSKTTACAATTCSVPTPGNGPENQVRVQVAARNAIGLSDPTAYSEAVWSNVVPGAPQNVRASGEDHSVIVRWDPPQPVDGASAVTSYRVSGGGQSTTVSAGTTSATLGGLTNGSPVTVTVEAMNAYYGPQPAWNSGSATATPAGAPIWSGVPTANAANDGSGSVTVGWSGAVDSNGADFTGFTVFAFQGRTPRCDADGLSVGPGQRSAKMQVASNETWSFAVAATNAQGCTLSAVVTATPLTPPDAPQSVDVSDLQDSGNHTYDAKFLGVSPAPQPGPGGSVSYRFAFTGAFGSDPAAIRPGEFMRATGHYGQQAQVRVQVVVSYDSGAELTSDWSPATSIGVPVSTQLGGLSYNSASHVFSWTSGPSGAYSSATVSCGASAAVALPSDGGPGTCQGDGGLLGDTLTVTVTSGSASYSDRYSSRDYDG